MAERLCGCGCGEPTTVASKNDRAKGWVKGEPLRYVKGHNWNKPRTWTVDPETGCWNWDGKLNRDGRGRVSPVVGSRKVVMAYRWVWEQRVGPLGDDTKLHHRCENPTCVNPEHLEPMTLSEHARLHGAERRVDWAGVESMPCTTCGEVKPAGEFHKWRERVTTEAWYCDPCAREYFRLKMRAHRAKAAA